MTQMRKNKLHLKNTVKKNSSKTLLMLNIGKAI